MRATELGEFLRSRRARVDPAEHGFPADRRRTPGLRREELASLAGVTVSWLAKLEQGSARSVSVEVLEALARPLHLDAPGRRHLLALAGYHADGADGRDAPVVTDGLRALVDQFDENPAYLLDRRWDMVAWNAAEAALFPPLAHSTTRTPNLLRLVFTDPDLAELMADHDEELRRLVAQFRLHAAEFPDDPGIAEIVEELRDRSPSFAELWDARDVAPFATTRRIFDHPSAGRLELDHHRLAVLDQPGMQLVVYTAVAGTTLRRLVSEA